MTVTIWAPVASGCHQVLIRVPPYLSQENHAHRMPVCGHGHGTPPLHWHGCVTVPATTRSLTHDRLPKLTQAGWWSTSHFPGNALSPKGVE